MFLYPALLRGPVGCLSKHLMTFCFVRYVSFRPNGNFLAGLTVVKDNLKIYSPPNIKGLVIWAEVWLKS